MARKRIYVLTVHFCKVREKDWVTGSGHDWIPLGQKIVVNILSSHTDPWVQIPASPLLSCVTA